MNATVNNNKNDAVKKDSDNQISTLCTQEKLALSSWGLPDEVLQFYARKGITHMFNWQLECLTVGKVLEGGNLVYSAPTSAGKTLVAEILIAQTIFERQKKVMLILPFVSVVREKMFYFQSLFSLTGIKVEGFMGGHSPSAAFQQVHMGVCTIEKGNSVVNRMLEEKNLNCLGLVVVDELHLLGDPYRGYLLELLLTKLKYMSNKLGVHIQIVGMSATLPNLRDLANWLNADLYYTCFRPIPLSENLKCGNSIYNKKLNKIREIVPHQSDVPDTSDHLGQLCLETLKSGHSILIFCPSKTWCETLADEIALFFKRHGSNKSAVQEDSPGWIIRNQINFEKISQVIEHLKMTPVGIDHDLHRTITYGVAFHHAGLTLDERDIIEGSFRNGSIRVLCATSTLSSGVNLPARRVIIRSPLTFGKVMDVLMYRQMIGRAGRMGVDSEGESILICKAHEKVMCQQLMSTNLKPIESCLGRGPLSSSLKRALLEIVASGIASTDEEVRRYINCTFLASSSKHLAENPISSCMAFLEENEFIRLQEKGTVYAATPLGQACLSSSMPPDEGLSLFRELERARRCFVLDTDLHIIYQVTPYSVSEQWTKLDWLHVLNIFENLPENMKRVGELVGVEESFLVRIAKGTLNPNALENKIKLSIHRRFYTALALQDLVNEVPLTEVAEKFECNKGTLQSLQQSAATYAGMVAEFTRKLGWGSVELIFSQFKERLQFGVHRELCELMRLPLLNVVRARALYNAGYTNLSILANASASDLELSLYSAVPFQTKKVIAGETTFERIQKNNLQTIWITGKADISVREAAETLIEQARNALELELGVAGIQWGNYSKQSQSQSRSQNSHPSKPSSHREHVRENKSWLNHTKIYNGSSFETIRVSKSNSHSEKIIGKGNECKSSVINNSPMNKFGAFLNSFVDDDESRREERHELSVARKNFTAAFTPLHTESTKFISTPCQSGTRKFRPTRPSRDTVNIEQNISSACTAILNGSCTRDSCLVENVRESGSNETDYFATSLNVDCVMNISEIVGDNKFGPQGVGEGSAGEVDESDCSSVSSGSSVAMLCERPIISNMDKTDRLSGDLFDMQEAETEWKEYRRPDLFNGNESKKVEVPDDLFSQSLTFDTQLQKMLDVDCHEPSAREKNKPMLSNSLNSDDLGFVSDFSPPKLKAFAEKEAALKRREEACRDSETSRSGIVEKNETYVAKRSPTSHENKADGNLSIKRHGQALKRKNCVSNSPDFIVGSDDSWIDDGHVSKKAKIRFSKNMSDGSKCNLPHELMRGSVRDDSDTEIMPTPKVKVGRTVSPNFEPSTDADTKSLVVRKRAASSKNSRGIGMNNEKIIDTGERNSGKDTLSWNSDVNAVPVETPTVAMEKYKQLKSVVRGDLSANIHWDKIIIIDVASTNDVRELFRNELNLGNIVGLALGCRKVATEGKNSCIGQRIKKKKLEKPKKTGSIFVHKDTVLDGVSLYFNGNTVFYVSFDADNFTRKDIMDMLKEISSLKNRIFRLFDAKEQVKMLFHFTSVLFGGAYEDPKTAHWLLSKSWKENSYSSIVVDYLPEAFKLISQLGPLPGFYGPGLCAKSSVQARIRACTEAFLSFHVIEKQLKFLEAKSLTRVFQAVEMPLVPCLAEMEVVGFRFDRDKLIDIKNRMESEKSKLSDKACSFARYKFSLASPAAVSKVLYKDLKLGSADSFVTKTRRFSTSKEALQNLSVETNHPLPDIIMGWRKIQSILTKVLSPLLEQEPHSLRLFPVSQLYTATGRLSMHEPNLQNMPRNFSLIFGNHERDLSVRDVFIPSEGCVLISVDYCQIELRLLAHFSDDEKLIESINSSNDIFVTIASHIYDVTPATVDDDLRQKAKKTCYGIIYGIGPRALSHQLRVEESVASALMEDFKMSFKGVTKYLENSLEDCRKKGYVTSLMGRRRYLPHINDPNPAIKGEAERQAINTRIQGSAADMLKIAMVKIREKIKDLKEEDFTFNLLLHLHDELLFEVDEDFTEMAACLLKDVMENVAVLKVSTPVKFHSGPSWGRLQPFEF